MKRQILSIALALCMLLSIVPMTPIVATAASSPSGVELKMDGTTLKYGDTEVEKTGDTGLTVTLDPDNSDAGNTIVHGYVLNGGTYYLDSDVTIDKPLIITGGTAENPVTLDLNGHVLKYENATQKSSVIVVADSAYFTLTDSNPDNAHTYTVGTDTGLYVLDDTNQSVHATLTGGVITGGTGTDINGYDVFGGGVFVGSTATFTMTGGNIVGCAVASTGEGGYAYGGGVFVAAGQSYTGNQQNNVYTKFTMTGGSIVGCTAASTGEGGYAYGGGVLVREYADFTMGSTDSTGNACIANCTATSGGGVYNKGTFTMVGSTIENCTASSSGGGVYNYDTFTMENGTIENCTATNGGGVYVDNRSFTMEGGTITDCTATSGGGVYINGIGMDAQGGSVYGGVYNRSTLKNASAEGSTIVYGVITKGGTPTIAGKRVTFKNGETTYAETVAGVDEGGCPLANAKISEPVAPIHPTDATKTFDGWYSKNDNGTHYRKFDFTEDTVTDDLTLYAAWGGDFEVEVSYANVGNGYYKSFSDAWSGAQGDGVEYKFLKNVDVGDLVVNQKANFILNDKTVSGNITFEGQDSESSGMTLTVKGGGTLSGTVTVGANNAMLNVWGGTVNAAIAENGGTVRCAGGTITTATVNNGGTLVCSSGTITTLNVNGGTVNHSGGTASCTEQAKCIVCNTSYGELAAHTGGEATCTDRAVCEVCGEEYGEVDNNNHDLENIKENAATVTETGNTEYWHCKDCDNNFSDKDGKNVIDLKDTVISKLAPEIIDGKGQSLTAGETRELTFRSNAAYSDFICVEVDGKTVDENNYTVKEGSTIVTLKADYVATLSAGEHTLGIVSESGTATTTFTVNAKVVDTNSPQTGDNNHMTLWIVLLFVSGSLLTVTGVYGKKKKRSAK